MKARLKIVLETLVSRLSEPSTWAGMAGLAAVAGVSAPAYAAYSAAASFVFGLLAVVFPEAK